MSTAALPSARSVAWQRRRRALAGIWQEFRHHRPGMIGLVVLIALVAMALAAPLLADESGLRAINATDNPRSPARRSSARWAPTRSAAT